MMSSMRRAAILLPLMALAASSSAQAPLQQQSYPNAYRPSPTVSNDVSWAIADWRRLRQSSGYSFGDYARFVNANPGWPGESTLRRNAERAIKPGENPATVLAFFASTPPVTGNGYAALADALLANGRQAEALAAAREAWASSDLGTTYEPVVYARYGANFSRADHDRRVDALLFDKKTSDAYRFLGFVSPQRAAAFGARIAMQSRSPDAERRYQPLMASVTSDAGLMMDRARYLRDNGFENSARQLFARPRNLIYRPTDPGRSSHSCPSMTVTPCDSVPAYSSTTRSGPSQSIQARLSQAGHGDRKSVV